MRFAKRRTHEDTLAWGEKAQAEAKEEVNGIFGKSIMFDVHGFNVIKDMFPEPMHLLDGGFMKNTCGRTFRQGKSAQTKDDYRRAPIDELNRLLKYVLTCLRDKIDITEIYPLSYFQDCEISL